MAAIRMNMIIAEKQFNFFKRRLYSGKAHRATQRLQKWISVSYKNQMLWSNSFLLVLISTSRSQIYATNLLLFLLQLLNEISIFPVYPNLMKKLLSVFCCVLYLQNLSQSPLDARTNSLKTSGKKGLIKALAIIINSQGNKKQPAKKINLSPSEWPRA